MEQNNDLLTPSRESTTTTNQHGVDTSGVSNLQDSEFTTTDSTTTTTSERNQYDLQDDDEENESGGRDAGGGNGNGWLGGMGADFRNIAHCLTDNVPPVVSGVAHLVHRTAVAVANEIAQLERDGELNLQQEKAAAAAASTSTSREEKGTTAPTTTAASAALLFPWEIKRGSKRSDGEHGIPVYFTDNQLMEDILALSHEESTFLQPFQEQNEDKETTSKSTPNNSNKKQEEQQSLLMVSFSKKFVMDESRINLISRLMDIDKELASAHSRFSGTCTSIEEHVFGSLCSSHVV